MTIIQESGGLAQFAHVPTPTGRRYRARLIEGDRWGSSGYYPADMLRESGPVAFPQGTQVFLDHPGLTEQGDRPERSVRDLAGTITTTPTYGPDGLYAEVEFFPHVAPVIESMAEHVGLSIRAMGTSEQGERDGRTGPVVTALTEGISVDVVTRPGAGGRLVQLLESARNHPSNTTTTDQKTSTPTVGETVTESEDTPMGHINITETEHQRLTEAATELTETQRKLTETEARVEQLESQLTEATKTARRAEAEAIVAEAFGDVEAPKGRARLIEAALTAEDFDPETFRTEAREAAAEYMPAGGPVKGMGATHTEAAEPSTEDILNAFNS